MKMKIKRFKYLKEKGTPEEFMFDVVRFYVIPSFNISFEEVIVSTMVLVPLKKQLYGSLWELYLNVLIQKYNLSKNAVEEAVKIGICERKKEVKKFFEKFMEKYNKIISEKQNKSD